jgi:uncharacterized protein YjbJ (UPF0337 family)
LPPPFRVQVLTTLAPHRSSGSSRAQARNEKSAVSILKKFRHKGQTAKGKTKKRTGRLTRNRRLKTEGRADQVAGETKQATDKVKDAFKH